MKIPLSGGEQAHRKDHDKIKDQHKPQRPPWPSRKIKIVHF